MGYGCTQGFCNFLLTGAGSEKWEISIYPKFRFDNYLHRVNIEQHEL